MSEDFKPISEPYSIVNQSITYTVEFEDGLVILGKTFQCGDCVKIILDKNGQIIDAELI